MNESLFNKPVDGVMLLARAVNGNSGLMDRVVRADWSCLPRFQDRIERLSKAGELDRIAETCRELFQQALREIGLDSPGMWDPKIWETKPLSSGPQGSKSLEQKVLHPHSIFYAHVILGRTWDVVQAELKEMGIPRELRQLQNLQRTAAKEIANWASEISEPKRKHPHWAAVAAFLLLTATALILRSHPTNVSGEVTTACESDLQFPSYVFGRELETIAKTDVSPEYRLQTYLPLKLRPDFGSPLEVAMALHGPTGCPRLVFGTQREGELGHSVIMWDVEQEAILWSFTFNAPETEVRMNRNVGFQALADPFFVRRLGYVPAENGRPGIVVAVCIQRWYPTFVVFLDESNGEEIGRYAHPGALKPPVTLDLDQDGTSEVVLGGCDNVLRKPVLVVLSPWGGSGAASTVDWSSGEAAKFRVILPTLYDFQTKLKVSSKEWYPKNNEIIRVQELCSDSFDKRTQALTLSVGMAKERAYYALLKCGSGVPSGARISLGTKNEGLWNRLGIPINWTSELEARTCIIRKGERGQLLPGSVGPTEGTEPLGRPIEGRIFR